MNKTLNDFHLPKAFTNVSQPKITSQENPYQRPSTLKLFPLIYQVSLLKSLSDREKLCPDFQKLYHDFQKLCPDFPIRRVLYEPYLQNRAPIFTNCVPISVEAKLPKSCSDFARFSILNLSQFSTYQMLMHLVTV